MVEVEQKSGRHNKALNWFMCMQIEAEIKFGDDMG